MVHLKNYLGLSALLLPGYTTSASPLPSSSSSSTQLEARSAHSYRHGDFADLTPRLISRDPDNDDDHDHHHPHIIIDGVGGSVNGGGGGGSAVFGGGGGGGGGIGGGGGGGGLFSIGGAGGGGSAGGGGEGAPGEPGEWTIVVSPNGDTVITSNSGNGGSGGGGGVPGVPGAPGASSGKFIAGNPNGLNVSNHGTTHSHSEHGDHPVSSLAGFRLGGSVPGPYWYCFATIAHVVGHYVLTY